MSVTRTLFAILAIGTALLAVVLPLTGTSLPVDPLVAILGNDYLVVVGIGGIAVLGAVSVQVRRRFGGLHQATPPDTEGVHVVPRLGSDLDDYLSTPLGVGASEPSNARSQLTRLAVMVVVQEQGCSREDARRRVEDGTWTTDPYAAAYLGTPAAESVSPRHRLRATLSRDSVTQHGARRAAAEILRRDPGVSS